MSASKTFVLAVFGLVLASVLLGGSAQAATWTTSETRTIGNGEYTVIMLYQASDMSGLSYTFNVQSGTAVDALIMDQSNFNAYVARESFSYLQGSILDSQSGSASQGTPSPGTTYYVVIDNTNAPPNGAMPTGSVQVFFSVTAMNADIPSFISDIVIIIAIGAVLFAVVILVVLYLLLVRRPKTQAPPPTGQPPQPGMKICPNCGSSVPYDFQYCPKCGRRW
jgi:Fe-S cluster assembly iron-binding protein IscA